MTDADVRVPAGRLLRATGLGEPGAFTRLAGGANNRVFRIETESRPVVLKAYFHHPGDRRDRLSAEYGFSDMAWRRGVRALPEPLAADREHHLGLYGLIPGRRLAPGEIDDNAVGAALSFFMEVNRWRDEGRHLPDASEACFTLADHMATVGRRLERLRGMAASSPLHADAARLVTGVVEPTWKELAAASVRKAERAGIAPDEPLSPGDRVLSPSDFGFHNALVDTDGTIRFLDFEYAGWDDPAKLIGDFFNQVAVPVPRLFYPLFRTALASRAARPEREALRFDLLLPVYTVKWIAIILNDFLPIGSGRRRFADPVGEDEERLSGQLAKAHRKLSELKLMAG